MSSSDSIIGKLTLLKTNGEDGNVFDVNISSSKEFIIGFSATADLRVKNPSIADQHCAIGFNNYKAIIRNLTRAVTYVNDVVVKGVQTVLKDNDIIKIANKSFRWNYAPHVLERPKVRKTLTVFDLDKSLVNVVNLKSRKSEPAPRKKSLATPIFKRKSLISHTPKYNERASSSKTNSSLRKIIKPSLNRSVLGSALKNPSIIRVIKQDGGFLPNPEGGNVSKVSGTLSPVKSPQKVDIPTPAPNNIRTKCLTSPKRSVQREVPSRESKSVARSINVAGSSSSSPKLVHAKRKLDLTELDKSQQNKSLRKSLSSSNSSPDSSCISNSSQFVSSTPLNPSAKTTKSILSTAKKSTIRKNIKLSVSFKNRTPPSTSSSNGKRNSTTNNSKNLKLSFQSPNNISSLSNLSTKVNTPGSRKSSDFNSTLESSSRRSSLNRSQYNNSQSIHGNQSTRNSSITYSIYSPKNNKTKTPQNKSTSASSVKKSASKSPKSPIVNELSPLSTIGTPGEKSLTSTKLSKKNNNTTTDSSNVSLYSTKSTPKNKNATNSPNSTYKSLFATPDLSLNNTRSSKRGKSVAKSPNSTFSSPRSAQKSVATTPDATLNSTSSSKRGKSVVKTPNSTFSSPRSAQKSVAATPDATLNSTSSSKRGKSVAKSPNSTFSSPRSAQKSVAATPDVSLNSTRSSKRGKSVVKSANSTFSSPRSAQKSIAATPDVSLNSTRSSKRGKSAANSPNITVKSPRSAQESVAATSATPDASFRSNQSSKLYKTPSSAKSTRSNLSKFVTPNLTLNNSKSSTRKNKNDTPLTVFSLVTPEFLETHEIPLTPGTTVRQATRTNPSTPDDTITVVTLLTPKDIQKSLHKSPKSNIKTEKTVQSPLKNKNNDSPVTVISLVTPEFLETHDIPLTPGTTIRQTTEIGSPKAKTPKSTQKSDNTLTVVTLLTPKDIQRSSRSNQTLPAFSQVSAKKALNKSLPPNTKLSAQKKTTEKKLPTPKSVQKTPKSKLDTSVTNDFEDSFNSDSERSRMSGIKRLNSYLASLPNSPEDSNSPIKIRKSPNRSISTTPLQKTPVISKTTPVIYLTTPNKSSRKIIAESAKKATPRSAKSPGSSKKVTPKSAAKSAKSAPATAKKVTPKSATKTPAKSAKSTPASAKKVTPKSAAKTPVKKTTPITVKKTPKRLTASAKKATPRVVKTPATAAKSTPKDAVKLTPQSITNTPSNLVEFNKSSRISANNLARSVATPKSTAKVASTSKANNKTPVSAAKPTTTPISQRSSRSAEKSTAEANLTKPSVSSVKKSLKFSLAANSPKQFASPRTSAEDSDILYLTKASAKKRKLTETINLDDYDTVNLSVTGRPSKISKSSTSFTFCSPSTSFVAQRKSSLQKSGVMSPRLSTPHPTKKSTGRVSFDPTLKGKSPSVGLSKRMARKSSLKTVHEDFVSPNQKRRSTYGSTSDTSLNFSNVSKFNDQRKGFTSTPMPRKTKSSELHSILKNSSAENLHLSSSLEKSLQFNSNVEISTFDFKSPQITRDVFVSPLSVVENEEDIIVGNKSKRASHHSLSNILTASASPSPSRKSKSINTSSSRGRQSVNLKDYKNILFAATPNKSFTQNLSGMANMFNTSLEQSPTISSSTSSPKINKRKSSVPKKLPLPSELPPLEPSTCVSSVTPKPTKVTKSTPKKRSLSAPDSNVKPTVGRATRKQQPVAKTPTPKKTSVKQNSSAKKSISEPSSGKSRRTRRNVESPVPAKLKKTSTRQTKVKTEIITPENLTPVQSPAPTRKRRGQKQASPAVPIKRTKTESVTPKSPATKATRATRKQKVKTPTPKKPAASKKVTAKVSQENSPVVSRRGTRKEPTPKKVGASKKVSAKEVLQPSPVVSRRGTRKQPASKTPTPKKVATSKKATQKEVAQENSPVVSRRGTRKQPVTKTPTPKKVTAPRKAVHIEVTQPSPVASRRGARKQSATRAPNPKQVAVPKKSTSIQVSQPNSPVAPRRAARKQPAAKTPTPKKATTKKGVSKNVSKPESPVVSRRGTRNQPASKTSTPKKLATLKKAVSKTPAAKKVAAPKKSVAKTTPTPKKVASSKKAVQKEVPQQKSPGVSKRATRKQAAAKTPTPKKVAASKKPAKKATTNQKKVVPTKKISFPTKTSDKKKSLSPRKTRARRK